MAEDEEAAKIEAMLSALRADRSKLAHTMPSLPTGLVTELQARLSLSEPLSRRCG